MKIGVIFCALNVEEYLLGSLSPWIEAKRHHLGGHDWHVCCVSVPFAGFNAEQPDGTRAVLRHYLTEEKIDHLIDHDRAIPETEARGEALRWLADVGVDLLWQADGDEMPTTDEIARILTFVESRPYVGWFRGSLRNCIFSAGQYLAEPFTPPRIHRVNIEGYQAHSFWDDNNVLYSGRITRDLIRDVEFPHVTIPKSVQFSRHLTWLSDDRGRRKVEYQTKARGWECSFQWNYELNQLEWNESFYTKRGLPLPEVLRDGI